MNDPVMFLFEQTSVVFFFVSDILFPALVCTLALSVNVTTSLNCEFLNLTQVLQLGKKCVDGRGNKTTFVQICVMQHELLSQNK